MSLGLKMAGAPATRHDGRAREGALLPTADTSSEEQNAFLLELRNAAVSVVPIAALELLKECNTLARRCSACCHRR